MQLVNKITLALFAALCLPACSMSIASSVSEHGGVLYLDDVALEFEREIELTGVLDSSELRLSTHMGSIAVTGTTDGEVALVLVLHTEFEGDGEVSLSAGALKASSLQGGKLLVDSIRGTIPMGTSLHVQSGTGRIVIRDMDAQADLDVDSGTGNVFVSGGAVHALKVSTGTGDVRLDNLRAETVRLSSGTGRMAIEHCHIGSIRGESGTGEFVFRNSEVDRADLTSGTGDVRLLDTLVSKLESSLGTGDVFMERSQDD
ncbi:MAG: hypothetical protein DRQ55_07340 [Planctomycetota bacterium]|nr:MAG: hypothetical protein DRQ55_07340 [Planctomycetota bacterium]